MRVIELLIAQANSSVKMLLKSRNFIILFLWLTCLSFVNKQNQDFGQKYIQQTLS